MVDLNVYTHEPASGAAPKQLVILLHGLGSDGKDLIGLAPYFAKVLPDAVFVSPDAPFTCDMAPSGFQWFSLQDRSSEAMLSGVVEATEILQGFVDAQLEKYGLSDGDLALIGFSQGTMMSLHLGPRRPDVIAGIMGYSGALILDPEEDMEALRKPPIYIVHGESDDIVPVMAYAHAIQNLQEAGFNVSGHTTEGLAHGIDDEGIKAGQKFLQECFS